VSKHRHRFSVNSYRPRGLSILDVEEGCACGETRTRKPTADENAGHRANEKDEVELHRLSRAFEKALGDEYGYEAMLIARRWAKKHPARIFVARIDDGHFCGSNIVFLTNETEQQYWGASAWVIPQCTGEKPMRFFLYPGDSDSLLEALTAVRKRERVKRDGRSLLNPMTAR